MSFGTFRQIDDEVWNLKKSPQAALGAVSGHRKRTPGAKEGAQRKAKRPPNEGREASGTGNGRIAICATLLN